jgi:hypothetical protein
MAVNPELGWGESEFVNEAVNKDRLSWSFLFIRFHPLLFFAGCVFVEKMRIRFFFPVAGTQALAVS